MNRNLHRVLAAVSILAFTVAPAFARQPQKRVGLVPYVCDRGLSTQTSQFVNDGHRFVLQITNSGVVPTLDCGNAGGIVRLQHTLQLNSVSVLAKIGGNVNICDTDLVWLIPGSTTPQGSLCFSDATQGATTADGYTQYTWNGVTLGFAGTNITAFGFREDGSATGFVNIDQVQFNVHDIMDLPGFVSGCPFSDPNFVCR